MSKVISLSRFIHTTSLLLLAGFCLASSSVSEASPGDLDRTFGRNGKVTTLIGREDRGFAVIDQPDGKLVVGGRSRGSVSISDFALLRYNSDGTQDTSFGTDGVVTTDMSYDDELHVLALQPDGKIIGSGTVYSSAGTFGSTAIARYNSDGSLDPAFGDGGKVLLEEAVDWAMVLQPDGKILLGGGGGESALANFKIARLNSDGTFDTSFGDGGVTVIDFAGSGDGVWSLALQSDGKIIAAGRSRALGGNTSDDFAAARLNTDGTLDTSFGIGGKVVTDFARLPDFGYAVVIQPDDKIIVAGQAESRINDWNFGLVRYNPDGSVDSSFGKGGKVTTQFSGTADGAFAVKLQPNGKIVAAGIYGGVGTAFALARYNFDGTPDTSFGHNGKVITFFNTLDEARSLFIQPDGKIVAAGTADGGGSIGEFALARYLGRGR